MSTQSKRLLTPEEYLEIERKAEFKSEYYNGEMFAMAGGLSPHNLIAVDAVFLLRSQVRAGQCFVYNSDMRVRVNRTGLYTYPDVSVVCGERKFLDDRHDTLLNPTLIIEVLSPSTEAYDRGRKFQQYRSLESLRAYLMIASDQIHVELHTRQMSGLWLLAVESDRLEDTLDLESIGCRLNLAQVYEQAALELSPPPTAG
jgi:Uma2 family endonuclease